jgi:hypothetical protein
MEGNGTTEPEPQAEVPGSRHSWLTRARRSLAGLAVLALAVVVLASYVPGSIVASCRDAVATSGAVRICAPIGPNDVVAVGIVLLVVVAFLWPDLSEFSIFGLVSLKKQVDANKRQIAAEKQTTKELQHDLVYVRLAQQLPNVEQVAREAKERVASFTIDAAIAPTQPGGSSNERGTAEAEFKRLASEIDLYVRAVTLPANEGGAVLKEAQARGAVPSGVWLAQLTALRKWRDQFGTDLSYWAVLRNVVAAGGADRLSIEDMRSANELGGILLTAAQKAVRAP